MSITLERAKELRRGEVLVDSYGKRWRVNGQVQRWKRNPDRIRVPLKHGLYSYDAITDAEFINGVCTLLTLEDS